MIKIHPNERVINGRLKQYLSSHNHGSGHIPKIAFILKQLEIYSVPKPSFLVYIIRPISRVYSFWWIFFGRVLNFEVFRIGSPTEKVIILLVTVTGKGSMPGYSLV